MNFPISEKTPDDLQEILLKELILNIGGILFLFSSIEKSNNSPKSINLSFSEGFVSFKIFGIPEISSDEINSNPTT